MHIFMYLYICVYLFLQIYILYVYLKNNLILELVTSAYFKQSSFLYLTSFSCSSPHPVPFLILFNFLSCDDSE